MDIFVIFLRSAVAWIDLLDAVESALDASACILNLLHALDKGGNGTTLIMWHIALLLWQSVTEERKKREREIIVKTEDRKKLNWEGKYSDEKKMNTKNKII